MAFDMEPLGPGDNRLLLTAAVGVGESVVMSAYDVADIAR